jgi:hypothetical protein
VERRGGVLFDEDLAERLGLVDEDLADARISWPRCRRPVGKSHPSLLLDSELARAVRTEAAAAVEWHWGVSIGVVNRWRKFLDVTRTNNPGTPRRPPSALNHSNMPAGTTASGKRRIRPRAWRYQRGSGRGAANAAAN